MPSLVIFNPNTDAVLTRELVASARVRLPGVECRGMTAVSGPRYIASEDGLEAARRSCVTALAPASVGTADGVVLACFGDPALNEVRAALEIPVFGMAECAFAAAARGAGRFAVVTGGAAWPPLIRELAEARGYGGRLVEVRAIAQFGAAARRATEETLAALRETVLAIVARHGPLPVVLGGTGLAPWYETLAASVEVPVLCSWRETLEAAADIVNKKR